MLSDWATDEGISILRADPENEGRFHYTSDRCALNFARATGTIQSLMAALRAQAGKARPYAIAAQGISTKGVLPSFAKSHGLPFAPQGSPARLWIGNAAKVATHNDPSENIAVVVMGRRKFTLFPPEQIANLYIGPWKFTPAGRSVSMVHVTAPDLQKYPRFANALEEAVEAELEPGDAMFIA